MAVAAEVRTGWVVVEPYSAFRACSRRAWSGAQFEAGCAVGCAVGCAAE